MRNPLRLLRRRARAADPYADALALAGRRAIRRSLADVRAETAARRASLPDDADSIAQLRRAWS